MPDNNTLPVGRVLSSPITVVPLGGAAGFIVDLARLGGGAYVCVANVHMVVTAEQDRGFLSILRGAAMVTSDGMPLVWELRRQGYAAAERVSGPDLMHEVCEMAAVAGVSVYFYGGSVESAGLLESRLRTAYPLLKVAAVEAPPILPERPEVDAELVERIRASGAGIVFVGLGCPKQEFWMAAYSGHLPAVLIGVGAAFDFLAGTKRRAPKWMQGRGLEWLYRLCSEPGRLWKRYLLTNSKYVLMLLRSRVVGKKRG